ncbi:MAG: phenylalanine--tRNA ligase subunit beta [Flavipsychrobacter sp.]|jgi:phenylalanyl-tRNA synthetase beta chain|nr:phenylalanine--tRNA ligase subunit beta [Flavipsychrobacter sp.]
MIISYQWLLEYLPEPLPVNELSKILTSIGLEVEAVEPVGGIPGGLEGLVIGEVLTCGRHPNADKLSVTTVNLGGPEAVQIVCGAPNVAAGQKVVVAPVGTTVHPVEGAPFLIKKAKIRGEESCGMICAEDEIGLGKSHAGIMILPPEAAVGMLAKEYFNIPQADLAIHIGLTPNRSDANSHIGVARDVCAYLTHHREGKYAVKMPVGEIGEHGNVEQRESGRPQGYTPTIRVKIEAPDACARYTGVSIKNIKVGASPEWLQKRLQTIGSRSINNIVDITNYVLHEYGQPLHAFDADKINGSEIIVKCLPEGTTFTALDEKERKLQGNDLMICDAKGPVAIGGVFGGLHSGINESTTNVFLESAYFDPTHIRRTSLHHGLRTDAATHFEKGVDINNVIPAMKRAAAMIVEVAGGEIASAVVDEYPKPLQPQTVTVTYQYIHKLSGKHYKQIAIQELLTASGFEIINETNEALTLKVPSNKTDVAHPADIVEEILRIDGLDNIQIPSRLNISLAKTQPGDREIRNRAAELLCGMGLQEILTNSIVNSKYYPERNDLVKMINSLSSELDVMRPSMLEGALEVIQYNCNRKSQDLSLFEFGNTYTQHNGKYIQEAKLAISVTGNVRTTHWDQKAQPANIFHLKGIINNLLNYGGIKNVALVYGEDGSITWKWKNQPLCTATQVTPKRLKEFDVKQDVYFAEINWDLWVKAVAAGKIKYTEVPKFPAVQRDIAIVIDNTITYEQVQKTTEQLKLDALHSFGLFDVFESEKLGQGKKSLALSYTFQLQDRTLTDAEIEQLMKQLMDVYKNKLSAQIRE